MHKRLVFALFIIAIAVIAIIFLQNRYLQAPEEKITASRVVVPQVDRSEDNDDESQLLDSELISMVALNQNETLLATVDMDFDGDGQDDQVNAIRVSGSPFISLIVGLFSPTKGEFERVATIATPIRQLSTFSYTGLDLTGDHRTALVYQGTVDTGKTIMQAFFINRTEAAVSVTQIADLEGEGTIFIEQTERSDSYMRALSNDPSYAIWVYSKDPATSGEIISKYDWDKEKLQYALVEQTQDQSSSAAQRQPMNSSDYYFAMLDGLWYKIDGPKGNMYYLLFDKEKKQILFMQNDQYELYEWVRSNPRSNGIYIFSTNDEITNFQRQIDISFSGSDQLRMRLFDNVLFLIAEGGSWNGEYKKMADATAYVKNLSKVDPKYVSFVEKLQSTQWSTADGIIITFDNGTYTAKNDVITDTGSYVALDNNGKSFIQFRSNTETPLMKKSYLMTRQDKQKDNILLQPYTLSPNNSYAIDDHVVILSPYSEED